MYQPPTALQYNILKVDASFWGLCAHFSAFAYFYCIRLNNKHIREENRKIVDVKECTAISIFIDVSSSTSHKKIDFERKYDLYGH